MPYPAKTDLDAVIAAAHGLIERDGIDQLSLTTLAAELGVKPPSLYRHVDSKSALVRAINMRTFGDLSATFATALQQVGDGPEARLWALFRAHRAFAHANPATYTLAFSSSGPGERGDEQQLTLSILPVQAIMAEISGEAHSLAALRGALALVHGFVMLELNNQLQRGGDLTEAFEASVAAYIAGWRLQSRRRT
jgi:AcrR family transcriptional regulator